MRNILLLIKVYSAYLLDSMALFCDERLVLKKEEEKKSVILHKICFLIYTIMFSTINSLSVKFNIELECIFQQSYYESLIVLNLN